MGDEVAAVDPAPGEAQDYFALLAVRPRALLPKLVLHWGCADDAAARVAALLGCDLVAEVSPGDKVAGFSRALHDAAPVAVAPLRRPAWLRPCRRGGPRAMRVIWILHMHACATPVSHLGAQSLAAARDAVLST